MMQVSQSVDFYFNVYKDEIYSVRLAFQLAENFPSSNLYAIADGPCHLPSLYQAKFFNPKLTLIEGERLKHKPSGGCEFTQRNLEEVVARSQAETIVKLDPDSYIWRSCEIPSDDWFGHVHSTHIPFLGSRFDFIAGGAMGFSRGAIERMVESRFLLDKKYDHEKGFYNRYKQYKKFGDPVGETDLIRREDWVIGDVCRRLKIKATSWDGVYCVQDEEQVEGGFSISHPVRCLW
jgi:hypothetical protein